MERLTSHKSSYSSPDGNCVEVADLGDEHRGVRDSKNPAGPALTVTAAQWSAFTAGIQSGQFED
ncbi:MAG: DUF397 domain-containing protein [Pseudonocardiales bacterium]|nr:DUF397 domain-containing protein [Pseudonocardiales bacterium]